MTIEQEIRGTGNQGAGHQESRISGKRIEDPRQRNREACTGGKLQDGRKAKE